MELYKLACYNVIGHEVSSNAIMLLFNYPCANALLLRSLRDRVWRFLFAYVIPLFLFRGKICSDANIGECTLL